MVFLEVLDILDILEVLEVLDILEVLYLQRLAFGFKLLALSFKLC